MGDVIYIVCLSELNLPKFRFFDTVHNMVVRMKHTKGKRNRVRSHHALKSMKFTACQKCGKEILPHVMCENCGYYRGRQVIDVFAKLDKKERKKREKELHRHEEEQAERGETLNAEELSHR